MQIAAFAESVGKGRNAVDWLAEGMGFEPTTPFGEHAFQACALNRSATPPAGGGSHTQGAGAGARRDRPMGWIGAHCVLFAGLPCAGHRLRKSKANPLRNRMIPGFILLSESV